MAITAEQRQERRHFIGSSDAPAIAGVDPWRSPFAVYLEKVFDVADLPGTEPIRRGNRYERLLVEWAAEQLGVEVEHDVSLRHPTDLVCGANLDGRVKGKRQSIEAKVTSLPDEFGEEGSDQIPDRVLVQAHHQMYVCDFEIVWVPVLLARLGRPQEVLFRVDRNEDLITAVAARNQAFWHEHIVPRIPPPDNDKPSLDVIRRIHREAGALADVRAELVAAWEEANEAKKTAEKKEELAKSRMLAELGDAEAGDFGDSARILTYFVQDRAGYSVKPTSFRVARIVKRRRY